VSTKITDNTSAVKGGIVQKANIFLRLMTDQMTHLSDPKTPKKTGRLRMDVLKQTLGLKAKVLWGKKYGAYQESKRFKNYTTPGTGPHFAENAAKGLPSLTEKVAKSSGLI
jgi:hypothetical protein